MLQYKKIVFEPHSLTSKSASQFIFNIRNFYIFLNLRILSLLLPIVSTPSKKMVDEERRAKSEVIFLCPPECTLWSQNRTSLNTWSFSKALLVCKALKNLVRVFFLPPHSLGVDCGSGEILSSCNQFIAMESIDATFMILNSPLHTYSLCVLNSDYKPLPPPDAVEVNILSTRETIYNLLWDVQNELTVQTICKRKSI